MKISGLYTLLKLKNHHCHSHFDSKIFNYQHENFKCYNVRRLYNKEVLLSKNEEKTGPDQQTADRSVWYRSAGPVPAMMHIM